MHAHLVPQLRGRLMRLTALLWCGGAVGGGLASALAFGHFGLGMLAMAGVLLLLAAGLRFPMMGVVWAAVVMLQSRIPYLAMHPRALLERYSETAVSSAGFMLLAGAGAALLPALFQRAGDRHLRWQARFACRMEVLRTGVVPESSAPGRKWWFQLQRSSYRLSLQRACSVAVPPMQMQMYALGPTAHWMIYIGTPVLVLALATLASFVVPPSAFLTFFMPVYMTFVVMIPLGVFVHSVIVAMYRTATEQGLMRLTPGAVSPVAFNRLFMRHVLGGFFKLWLVCAICSTVAAKLLGGAEVGWIYALALATMALPFSTLLVRDYAAMRAPYGSSSIALGVAGALVLLALTAAVKILLWPWIWDVVGIACALLTALLLVRGWRRMMALPAAFPARRMALD